MKPDIRLATTSFEGLLKAGEPLILSSGEISLGDCRLMGTLVVKKPILSNELREAVRKALSAYVDEQGDGPVSFYKRASQIEKLFREGLLSEYVQWYPCKELNYFRNRWDTAHFIGIEG